MEAIKVACVASVSNRVIAQKLERKQKKVEGGGGGGGEKRKRLPANPTVRFICKLTACRSPSNGASTSINFLSPLGRSVA